MMEGDVGWLFTQLCPEHGKYRNHLPNQYSTHLRLPEES